MKKKVMCLALVAILLLVAIPVFAEIKTYSAAYSASEVNHKFLTSNAISKSSSEQWTEIQDVISYSRYCDKDTDEVVNTTGSHATCLATASGTIISSKRSKTGAGTISFGSSDLVKANSVGTVKFWIYNPKYNSEDNVYLQTLGTIKGKVKQGFEEQSIHPYEGTD